jgi:signal peptidase II
MSALPPSASDSREAGTVPASASAKAEVVNHKSYLTRLLAYRRLWVLAIVVFALDQFTKGLITARLPLGSYGASGIKVFPGLLNFVHVGNTGAAWSMFSGQGTLLGLLAIGTLGAIFLWRQALGLRHPAAQIAFGLLCGGILGNLLDRLKYKYVVDFIDVHIGNYIYPTFNVADSAICIGVFWYVLWSIRQPATSS